MHAAMAREPETAAPPAAQVLWQRLRGRLVSAVRDANFEAGEPIWTVEEREGPGHLEIRSTCDPGGCAELVLDEPRARVTCRFGACAAERWRFQIVGARLLLRRASSVYDARAAVDAILNRLVGAPDTAAGSYCVTLTTK